MFIKCLIILLYFSFFMFEFSIFVHFGRRAGRASRDNNDNLAAGSIGGEIVNQFTECAMMGGVVQFTNFTHHTSLTVGSKYLGKLL